MADDETAGPATHRNADGLTPVEQGRLDAQTRLANIYIYLGLAGLVLIAAVFVVVGFMKPPARPTAPFWLAGGYLVLGSAYFSALRRWGRRRLRSPGPARDLVVSAGRKDIRRINRRLRAGKTIDDADRPTAQAIVNLNYRQRRLIFFLLPLIIASQALLVTRRDGDPIPWICAAVLVIEFPVAIWLQHRMMRTAAEQGILPQDPR